jgi:tetratricopeptide (TPR) repeat protein
MVNALRPLAMAAVLTATGLATTSCQFSLIDSLNLPSADVDRARLERATDVNPRNAHAWFLKGRAHLDDNDPAGARAAFGRAIQANGLFEEAHLGVALSYMNESNWPAAARKYEAVARKFPTSPAAFEGLAAAELGRNNIAAAEKAATKALELDPASSQALRLLGEVEYARGNYEAALAKWEAAGKLNPRLSSELEGIRKDLGGYLARYGQASGL